MFWLQSVVWFLLLIICLTIDLSKHAIVKVGFSTIAIKGLKEPLAARFY
jgi:hypothetical protein